MGEGFLKFKKRALLKSVIKSVVCGLSFGLFAVGATLLISKLLGISLYLWVYIALGVGVALFFGGLTFLLCRPNDKKLAIELDERYELHEKVQTAIAFTGASGPLVALQQADADSNLATAPKRKSRGRGVSQGFRKIWQYFVIVPIAVAVAVIGAWMPMKVADGASSGPVWEEDPFILSDLQILDMQNLVADIEASELSDEIKVSTVKSIQQLLGNLSLIDVESEMRVWVSATLKKINTLFTAAYTYQALANALATVGQMPFATIIAEGAQVYRSYPLTTYDEVKSFHVGSVEKIQEVLNNPIKDVFADLQKEMGSAPAQIFIAAVASRVEEEDALYKVLMALATSLKAWTEGASSPQAQFYYDVCDALAGQAYIHAMNRYITFTIGDVFGVTPPPENEFVPRSSGSNDDDGDDKPPSSGGYGDGSLQGGSDDKIYNPKTGEYEKYMDIINEYQDIVDEIMGEGNLSQEQIDLIRSYFDILYKGF